MWKKSEVSIWAEWATKESWKSQLITRKLEISEFQPRPIELYADVSSFPCEGISKAESDLNWTVRVTT